MKKQTINKLRSLNQDLLSTLKNKDVAQKMEAVLDSFDKRWDNLAKQVEKNLAQVSVILGIFKIAFRVQV